MHMLVLASRIVYILLQRTFSLSRIDPSWMLGLHSLHLVFQEQHIDCFTIRRWQEALTVYPRTNKQNQKKKRKVDPPTHQVMLFRQSIVNPLPTLNKVTIVATKFRWLCLWYFLLQFLFPNVYWISWMVHNPRKYKPEKCCA